MSNPDPIQPDRGRSGLTQPVSVQPDTGFTPNPRLGWIAVTITMLIWGSFTLISRMGAKDSGLTAWDIGALRFAVSAAVLIPVALYQRRLGLYFKPRALMLALSGGLLYATLAYLAFAHAPAAHAAIWLNGFLPFMTAMGLWILLGERPKRDTWLSLACIAAGIGGMMALMAWQGSFHLASGDGLFLLSSACWGMYTGLLRRWAMPPWEAMNAVAIGSAIVYLPLYGLFAPKGLMHASWGQIVLQGLFQGIFVVIVAMLTYIAAVRHLGAFRTGSILAMAPLLAAVAAVPLLNEPLTAPILVGIGGMLCGALQPWKWRAR